MTELSEPTENLLRFEVFTAVTMKNVFLRGVRRLLVKANVFPGSQILVTVMMEVLFSSEALVLTRTTRRNIPEDGILQLKHLRIGKGFKA
jgi:hypothetical protein